MAIANPRIHIICGLCGSNKDLHHKIEIEIEDGESFPRVYITCGNCASMTALYEVMEEIY